MEASDDGGQSWRVQVRVVTRRGRAGSPDSDGRLQMVENIQWSTRLESGQNFFEEVTER